MGKAFTCTKMEVCMKENSGLAKAMGKEGITSTLVTSMKEIGETIKGTVKGYCDTKMEENTKVNLLKISSTEKACFGILMVSSVISLLIFFLQ